ncbi:hypothetical protein nbrc107697_26190 [Gordonia crocea]|uniref:Uncharacterized protein n=1 Tax=Gordonia crocea TaxID=589162 RepID=A0A7I9V0I7_9ACTN|nr:hypothetical protein nbrc107697_26190 [Gordonia crocea]
MNVGTAAGDSGIGTEMQSARRQLFGDERVKARFKKRCPPVSQVLDTVGVGIYADHIVTQGGETCCLGGAQAPEADDTDRRFHLGPLHRVYFYNT